VSRITQGRIQLKQEAVDVASIIGQAVEINQAQINSKQQRLTVSTAASRPLYVQGDIARLVQCVGNLLSNASKYTGPDGEIKVNVSSTDEDVVIEITDSGSGIEADLLPHIFDLFVQSHRTLDRSQGGLGVGLAVVQRLVNLHGGAVSASSAGAGQGATFTIRLPQLRRSAAAPAPEEPSTFLPRRILVIDDNVDAAGSLAMLLELRGHVCQAVHHASEALAEVERCNFDVAVVDLGLPDIDGYALAGMLRANESSAGTRLVALTGYGQPEDRRRTIEAGFDAHLVKPVEIDLLEQALY
jgi:CheY-like chemotaxis protein/anti-sigma regulatory factor (Ser/Thr protein kinase)